MPTPPTTPTRSPQYQAFLAWVRDFGKQTGTTPFSGASYDLPEITVYHTATHASAEGAKVEVNITTPEAQPHFAWAAEITLDDPAQDLYRHLLLQADGEIVETYGKRVLPVSAEEAERLLEIAKRLTA